MSTTTLLQSIKKKWDLAPGLTSLVTGGLYLSQVPEKLGSVRIDLPYAVVEIGRTKFSWTMTSIFYETSDVEFIILAAGSAANLETIIQKLHDEFDWKEFPMDPDVSSKMTYFRPLDDDVTCTTAKYRDGSLVYRAHLRFEAFISRIKSNYV